MLYYVAKFFSKSGFVHYLRDQRSGIHKRGRCIATSITLSRQVREYTTRLILRKRDTFIIPRHIFIITCSRSNNRIIMPKAQKESRSSDHRANPMAASNAHAPTQPPGSKDFIKSENTTDDEKGPMNSSNPREANPTSLETSSARPANLLILATLRGTTRCRLLSVPPSLNFETFHEVLQIHFGWTDSQTHVFLIHLIAPDPRFPDPRPRGPMPNGFESGRTLGSIYLVKDWGTKAYIGYIHNQTRHLDLAFLGRATPGTNAHFSLPDDMEGACLYREGQITAEAVARNWPEGTEHAHPEGGNPQAG